MGTSQKVMPAQSGRSEGSTGAVGALMEITEASGGGL